MEIHRIYIENFGKLSRDTFTFEKGLNVIEAPNGAGKSTLAAFIKVMLYGFDSKKEAGTFDNERNVYMPWQGGTFGGEIDFSAKGKEYRLVRSFGRTAKTDTFQLFLLPSMLPAVDFKQDIGEEIFELDSASFRRSIYIAQNDCMSHTTDSINAKLGNLVDNTDDMNHYELAQEQLKELANHLTPDRVTGSLKRRRNEITGLKQEILSLTQKETEVLEYQDKKRELQEKKKRLLEERSRLAAELQKAGEASRREEQQQTYLALCKEQESKLAALVPFQVLFPQGLPQGGKIEEALILAGQEQRLKSALQPLALSQEEKTRLETWESRFQGKEASDKEIASALQLVGQLAEQRQEENRLSMLLTEKEKESLQMPVKPEDKVPRINGAMALGGLVGLLGLLGELYFASRMIGSSSMNPVGLGGALLVFLLGLLLVNLGIRKKTIFIKQLLFEQGVWEETLTRHQEEIQTLLEEEKQCQAKLTAIENELKHFLTSFGLPGEDAAAELFELKSDSGEYRRLREKKEEFERHGRAWMDKEDALLAVLKEFGLEESQDRLLSLQELQKQAVAYQLAKDALEEVKSRSREFEQRTDVAALFEDGPAQQTAESINLELEKLQETMDQLQKEIEENNHRLAELGSIAEQLELRQQELEGLVQQQTKEEGQYQIICQTRDFLKQAKEQFTSYYMAPISMAFEKYYHGLMGDQDREDWAIDANVTFKKKEAGQYRKQECFSAGLKDLTGICMRLALVDAMFEGEKPFLILDDPFVNLDAEKTRQGMKLLGAASGNYQLIYFTCHNSRNPQVLQEEIV